MKTLPHGLLSTTPLFVSMRHAVCLHALAAAAELGLFDFLAVPRSAEDTAAALGLHASVIPYFLELLVLMGAMRHSAAGYQSTPESLELYARETPAGASPLARVLQGQLLAPLHRLGERLRNGPATAADPTRTDNRDDIAGAASWAFRGVAEKVAGEIAALPGAGNFRRILDLGGGHGVFSLYLAQTFPRARVEILDFPDVLEHARRHIAAWEAEDRVAFLPGNYLCDPIPEGYDCILASCTLNFCLPQGQVPSVVRTVYNALRPGGWFVGLHDSFPSAAEPPSPRVPPWGHTLECLVGSILSGMPMAMPAGLIADCMRQSGFSLVQSRPCPEAGGIFSLDMAQK